MTRAALGRGLALAAVLLAFETSAASIAPAAAAPGKPAPAAAAGGRFARMNQVLAYNPTWLGDTGQLAFLGNGRAASPVNLYVWNPATGRIGAATAAAAGRHSLAGTPDGRLAYVERSKTTPTKPGVPPEQARAWPQPGPESLVVQDLRSGAIAKPFSDGWVSPGSVRWSPDGKRLALITLDRRGVQRLAVLDADGGAFAMIELGRDYELPGVVGWTSGHDVLVRAVPPGGGREQLLLVGRSGTQPLPGAEAPQLSPDGQLLLCKAAGGVALRPLNGGPRLLRAGASNCAWSPSGERVYVAVDRDVLALDLRGRVLQRWRNVARMAVGQLVPAPDGRSLAYGADYGLAVMPVR